MSKVFLWALPSFPAVLTDHRTFAAVARYSASNAIVIRRSSYLNLPGCIWGNNFLQIVERFSLHLLFYQRKQSNPHIIEMCTQRLLFTHDVFGKSAHKTESSFPRITLLKQEIFPIFEYFTDTQYTTFSPYLQVLRKQGWNHQRTGNSNRSRTFIRSRSQALPT